MMEQTILFLRPFWDADITAEQLKAVYRAIRPFGKLIAVRNGKERTRLRLIGDENPWARRGTFLGNIYNFLNPPLNLTLIEATDETWQKHAIEQIGSADSIIVHLAPRKGHGFNQFVDIQPSPIPRPYHEDSLYELVHETGTGQGLLRELSYCEQANCLDKVIVLIPLTFYPHVTEALGVLEASKAGTYFRKTEEGLVALTPRLSALDESLSVLSEVPSIIPYRKFGESEFNYRLRQALSSHMASLEGSQKSSKSREVLVDIPSHPVSLPPDGKLKHIRFSPIQSLVKIPLGEIVELSFDEVITVYPELANERLECPRCHRNIDTMFWYQYGLEPNLSKDAGTYMRCQYCGHDDYL